jgi:TetR/AcrR family transcriptional repressor of nem operon
MEHCDDAGTGCPVAALAPELARVDSAMRGGIVGELVRYRDRMLPFMPGRRKEDKERAFFAIWSTMIGAISLARILPFPEARVKVLGSARDLLLRSY